MALVWERIISGFKYLLAVFMILAGIITATAPLAASSGPLGFLFASRLCLIGLGCILAGSGITLLYAKLTRSRRWTGRGLMYVYLCFVFAALLNILSSGTLTFDIWGPNIVMSLIVGALYLRWRLKTHYITPNYFREDIRELKDHMPPEELALKKRR